MECGQIVAARIATLSKYVDTTDGELEVTVKRSDGTRMPLTI